MKRALYLGLLVGFLTASFLLGAWHGRRESRQDGSAQGPRILYYVDPMNPAHTSPEPGSAPCGMPMEPVYADEEAVGNENSPNPHHPGAVKISSERQQHLGVRVDKVERTPLTTTIKATGLVALDETRIYRINSSATGWVREVFAPTTGSLVSKGEPLFAYYTPTFINAQQSYFYILNTLDSLKQNQFDELERQSFTNVQFRTAVDNLRNLGVDEDQLRELAHNRRFMPNIVVGAPASGFVIARNVYLEQKFEAGAELYQLADLSRVWVLVDIYGQERNYISTGQIVNVFAPDLGQYFLASVSQVLPQFDPASRTMKVRLDVENPEYVLRPNMFVQVEFTAELLPAFFVPIDAVLDSGARKTVYVESADGFFEPREIRTGRRFGGRVEIVDGLSDGERIAVSGNFLIDSESRMRLAAAGFYGGVERDPMCLEHVDSEKAEAAGLKMECDRKTYYFCSEGCMAAFETKFPECRQTRAEKDAPDEGLPFGSAVGSPSAGYSPERVEPTGETGVLKKEEVSRNTAIDPVCRMLIAKSKALKKGFTSPYEEKTYYFCSKWCKTYFERNPQGYAGGRAVDGVPVPEGHRP